jgi:carbamoyl-phosphate synthase large subunit
MKGNRKNILLLSAGRRVALLKALKCEIKSRGLDSLLFATDLKPNMSAACQLADKAFEVSLPSAPDYIDQLLNLCIKESVGLIIPTIDTELLSLARARDSFSKEGIQVVVSDESLIHACRDKRSTANLFHSIGINTPKILDPNHLYFPCFVKPFDGSRSVGAAKLAQASDFTEVMRSDPKLMFMEYIDKTFEEFTLDAYFSCNGEIKCMVPRHRLEVRDGEISKGVTRNNHIYDYFLEKLSKLVGARGCLTIQLFAHPENRTYLAIEINPRFGGGYPLSYAAGANYPGWLLDEYLLNKEITFFDGWEANLLMLRYDEQILIHDAH